MSGQALATVLALTFLVAVTVAPSCVADDRDAGEGPPADDTGYVALDVGQLYVRSMGSGDPVVVVHGGPSIGHGYLVPQLRPLTDGFRLIFYDQRGVGRSSGLGSADSDSSSVDFGTFVEDLETLRRSLELEDVILLGHSWGGLLSMAYAVTHPARVDRLILLSPTEPGGRYAEQLRKNLRNRTTAADSAERARLFRSPAFTVGRVPIVDSLYRNTFRPWLGDRSLTDRLSFGLDRTEAEKGRRAAQFAIRGMSSVVSWQVLPRIRTPTLILHGERDPLPMAMARDLEAGIPDARLVALPESGHFPALESPEATFEAIRDFLNHRHQPSGPSERCADSHYRDFDFWLGEWRVQRPDGELAGRSRISRVFGGCAIREDYESPGGYRGGSYNIYDVTTGGWHQTWVDNGGLHLRLDGGLEGESMILSGTRTNREGEEVTDRITWTPLDGGRVRQLWEISQDGGETWESVFEGIYFPAEEEKEDEEYDSARSETNVVKPIH